MQTTITGTKEAGSNVKKLKVYSIFRDKVNESIRVPEIRISGMWLEKIGFNRGKNIMVTIDKGSLTLQVLDE
jgi:hypothetical protein